MSLCSGQLYTWVTRMVFSAANLCKLYGLVVVVAWRAPENFYLLILMCSCLASAKCKTVMISLSSIIRLAAVAGLEQRNGKITRFLRTKAILSIHAPAPIDLRT